MGHCLELSSGIEPLPRRSQRRVPTRNTFSAYWWEMRDSNPHAEAAASKTAVATNYTNLPSATQDSNLEGQSQRGLSSPRLSISPVAVMVPDPGYDPGLPKERAFEARMSTTSISRAFDP